jgi:hypothetical protein
MKKLLLALLAGTLAFAESGLAANPGASDVDLVVLGTVFMPEDDDVYDDSYGAELQFRFWMNPTLGLALAGGWARWDVDDQNAVIGDGLIITETDLGGDIDLFPVGLSLLIQAFNTDSISLVLEAGARYVFVDDDTDVVITTRNARGVTTSRERLKIDDGIVALAMAHLEFKLSEDVYLLAGAGYQWDIDKGDVDFLSEDIQDNKLEAALIQAGLGIRF